MYEDSWSTHLEVDGELGLQGHAVQAVQVLPKQVRQPFPSALIKQRCIRLARCACTARQGYRVQAFINPSAMQHRTE